MVGCLAKLPGLPENHRDVVKVAGDVGVIGPVQGLVDPQGTARVPEGFGQLAARLQDRADIVGCDSHVYVLGPVDVLGHFQGSVC